MNEPAESAPPLAAKLMQGTIWTVAMRWGVRLLGIVSMVVLVRLLQSEDFGLIAMAMAVVALVDKLTDFGIVWALVRNKHAARPQFDTAWTVRQGQLVFVAVAAFLAAPFAASAYEDPRVTDILQLIALSFIIRGFENIGIVEFQRQLQFHRDFLYRVLVKLFSVVATIALAIWLRSYWALAIGMVVSATIGTVLSYVVSPYRPKWSIAVWRELWAFSQWILSQGIARYLYEKTPVLVLGRLSNAESVGYYTVSSEIAALPATEVAMPVSRAVFPGFAKLVDEPDRLRNGYLKALGAVATVTIPLGFGIASVADEIVRLILGEQWLPAVTLLQIFAMFATFRALDSLSGNLLMVIDKVRSFSTITWIQAAIIVAGIASAFEHGGLEGVALLKALGSLVGLVLLTRVIVRQNIVAWTDVFKVLLGPTVAGLAMLAAILGLTALLPGTATASALQTALNLLAKVFTGGVVYLILVWTIWILRDKPDGLEALLIGKLRKIVRKSPPSESVQ